MEIRKFETGATRNIDTNKLDYEGFLSPLVLEEFGRFMHRHRVQANGELRDSDNWQKGIPLSAYMKSGWRHFFSWWKIHRGHKAYDEKNNEVDYKEEICALIFNAQGYLHERLKAEGKQNDSQR
jgi:hypothetical protein